MRGSSATNMPCKYGISAPASRSSGQSRVSAYVGARKPPCPSAHSSCAMRAESATASIQEAASAGLHEDLREAEPTSLIGMDPRNPLLPVLAKRPLEGRVRAHSIIPVKEPGEPRGQNDGVVDYASAHLEAVDSEYVTVSGHSCQSNPDVIAELRRILYEELAAGGPAPASRSPAREALSWRR